MKPILTLTALLFTLHAQAGGVPETLLQMAGVDARAGRLSDSVLVIIDAQGEYVDGALALPGVKAVVDEAEKVLVRARAAHTPVVHVMQLGKPGLFDPAGPHYASVAALAPKPGEAIVEKRLPNAFAGTELRTVLQATGRRQLIVVGFMTHMCVSATVRAALDQGYMSTVVAGATATRDLPDGEGGVVAAKEVQRVALAALADRFAVVVRRERDILE